MRSATSSRGRSLLTHIHLDHAAATGALVRRWPDLEVYVHERGAPHLIDPSKLLASAERLYGDQMRAPLGRDRAGAGGQREAAQRRRDGPGDAGRLHPRPRLPPRLLPARGQRHRLRRRRRRRPHPALEPDRAPHPAAGHRRRGLGRLDRHRRGLAARAPRPDPLRRRSRTRAEHLADGPRAPARGGRAGPRALRGRLRAPTCERRSRASLDPEAAAELLQAVPPPTSGAASTATGRRARPSRATLVLRASADARLPSE